MSIRVQTGNKVDVVLDVVDGKLIVIGIQPWDFSEMIRLPDPKALADVINNNLGASQK